MTTLTASRCGFTIGLAGPAAGPTARSLARMTADVLQSLKTQSGSGFAYSDLQSLANEHGLSTNDGVFKTAQRFLLALPTYVSAPELALDRDGEVVFDWVGAPGRMLTLALREDGRLTYAARFSAMDKEHGTKRFVDEIPQPVLDLVQRTTG